MPSSNCPYDNTATENFLVRSLECLSLMKFINRSEAERVVAKLSRFTILRALTPKKWPCSVWNTKQGHINAEPFRSSTLYLLLSENQFTAKTDGTPFYALNKYELVFLKES